MVLISRCALLAGIATALAATDARAQLPDRLRGRFGQKAADTTDRFGRGLAGSPGFSGGPRPILFGFALECTRCQPIGPRGGFGAGPRAVWHYDEFPKVAQVAEQSPAARAGIRQGDVLSDVDGMSLLTEAGAARFSSLRAGDDVTLTLERAGKPYSVSIVLGRPAARGGPLEPDLGPQPSRFTTRVGNTAVDVTSDVPVVASTDSAGTTLRIGSTTVRLKPTSAPKAP